MTAPRLKPFLRDYAEQALPIVQAIQAHHQDWHEAVESGDVEAEMHVLGPLGEAYRLLGKLDAAVPHLERALALSRELDKPKFVASNLIRLATAYQYAGRHAEAEPLFQEALALTPRLGLLEDFALQHYGKCLAELGRWDEAIACFGRALAMRTGRGSEGLVASSREALDEALARRARLT